MKLVYTLLLPIIMLAHGGEKHENKNESPPKK